MDFNLSEERRMLTDTAERFIRERYGIEKRHEFAASELGFSREMWRDFAGLGLIGALMPPEAGGYGGTGEDISALPAARSYFNMRKASIYGGSNEIQRNIVAKHLLGF